MVAEWMNEWMSWSMNGQNKFNVKNPDFIYIYKLSIYTHKYTYLYI